MAQSKKTRQTAKVRQLKRPDHRSLRLTRRPKHPVSLPNVLQLWRGGWRRIMAAPLLFGVIVLMYGLLTQILVRGFSDNVHLGTLKTILQQLFHGHWAGVSTGVTLFGVLLGSVGSGPSPTASLYESILIVVFSLVFIWSLRQVQAGHKVGIRDAFYKSLYPLVPFLLVLLVMAIELLPLILGTSLYNTVVNNDIAVGFFEKSLWFGMFFMLALLSLYWLSSSLMALYIVTLPNMTPIQALRTARNLVRYRRWTVLRKIVFLPLALLVIAVILVVPFIIVWAAAAPWVFFIYTIVALVLAHAYLYNLYRELL